MIIGLTGSMGSGKGEVVKILSGLGFKYVTLSEMVREEARKRGVPEEREKLMEVGNSMRKTEGNGVLAKRALAKITASEHENWVIDGIRNPAEVDELKYKGHVHVIGLQTSREQLVERILKRARPSDPKTRDEVLARIEREWQEGFVESGQQVGRCMQKADKILNNGGTLKDLEDGFMKYYNTIL